MLLKCNKILTTYHKILLKCHKYTIQYKSYPKNTGWAARLFSSTTWHTVWWFFLVLFAPQGTFYDNSIYDSKSLKFPLKQVLFDKFP